MTTLYLARYCLNASRMASLWVSNPYRVHQRLMMAYGEDPRLLFRIEIEPDPGFILVQSHTIPDWQRAFEKFNVLGGLPEYKPFNLSLIQGGLYRFRILANPTVKRKGKRFGLTREDEQTAWLARKLEAAGAGLHSCLVKPWRLQRSERNPEKDSNHQTHLAVLFEGLLEARNPGELVSTVSIGIGSAKAYGFGLLSLARAG